MSKIIFVYYPWEKLGGALTRVTNILRALSDYSFEISLLILPPRNTRVLSFLREMLKKNLRDTAKIDAYVLPLGITKKIREENLWVSMFLKVFIHLAKFLIREKRRQVILHSRPPFYIMAASTIVAKLFRIKSVNEIHHHIYADYKNAFLRFFLKILQFMILHFSDLIVVNSKTFSRYLQADLKVNPSKIVIVSNCVPIENLETYAKKKVLKIDQSGDLIGFVGSLKPEEDLLSLIKAFKMILQEKPNTILIIIGGGPIEHYKKIASKLEIEERVLFLGEKSHEETLGIMGEMRIFVAPRIRSERTKSASPIKIIEALALGIPVISTDLPPIREIAGDAAILTPPQDPQSLATAIKKLLNDETLRQDLIKRGKKRALNYDCHRAILPLVSKLKRLR